MSSAARFMIGLSLLSVPGVVYGGLTLLGVLSAGAYGVPAPEELSSLQQAYYRAGHAHAGVLVLLSLIIQLALDHTRLDRRLIWVLRIAAPVAAVLVSGGFFAVAHLAALRWLLYAGAACVAFATVTTGIGLLYNGPVRH